MGWARLDDTFATHPKQIAAGLEASGLDARAIAWCAGYATDGFVPESALAMLASGARSPRKVAERLVAVGRWSRDEKRKGWWVHDFLDYNRSADEDKKRREYEREKKRRQRQVGSANVDRDSNGQFVPTGQGRDNDWESRRESPATRPVPSRITNYPSSEEPLLDANGSGSDNKQKPLDPITQRVADNLDGPEPRRRGEATAIIDWARQWLDDTVTDEAIGRCLTDWQTRGRPRHPSRYLRRSIENAGRDAGLTPPPTPLEGGAA